ncbi:hypothetical protein V3A08_03820 [Tenacibaculum maritimum]|uniref:hypothetical protein n=1 Tax=Tenacibaculum maritimum TaxID=107401 RepID=UPI0012E4B8DF|nr:hypothetical protein [Tenacibaculum maritimum]MDB0600094.1 hypothetical protein [Tenacibaculum maritimum]MDB0611150.1 hypothetical protein [Tenacibaculum maritimum]CAA0179880.1 Putative transmembrane protein [Tenacibaculum maritimum]
MASLLHIIFECIRIGTISFLYGCLIYFILIKICKRIYIRKRYITLFLFIALFLWRTSYWRNNGCGDIGRVPLTSKYEITMIDFWYGSIVKNGKNLKKEGATNGIRKLYFENNMLYAASETTYLILNTENEKLYVLSQDEFLARGGNLNKLMTTHNFHANYWGLMLIFM